MQRRPHRFLRRFAALAPVLAALGGQALAAGSLRAPFLPHAGTTPAPWFSLLTTGGPHPADGTASDRTAAGIAALRAAVAASRRTDLEARLAALLAPASTPLEPRGGERVSDSRDIAPPGGAPTDGGRRIDATCCR